MKKLLTAAVLAGCVASMANAVNVRASVYFNTEVAGQTADKDNDFYLFHIKKEQVQDDDALIFEANGERAGAKFWGWYTYRQRGIAVEQTYYNAGQATEVVTDGTGDPAYGFFIRNVSLWFKPLSWLKVSVGDVSSNTYVERIHWWKAQRGQPYMWSPQYQNFATIDDPGLLIGLTPIDGLEVNLGISTVTNDGYDDKAENSVMDSWWHESFKSDDGVYNYRPYGVSAKYQITDTMSAAIAWRDRGRQKEKILAVGADFGNWGTPYYGFLNARMQFNGQVSQWGGVAAGEEVNIRGICFDNYFKYKYEDFIFEIALPVTVRFNNWKEEVNSKALNDDPSFMTFDFRVKYSQDWGTPYLEICDNDTFAPVVFNDDMGELIGVVVQPGALFDIEGCKIDVGFKNEITAKDGDGKHRYGWSIPVTLRMNF